MSNNQMKQSDGISYDETLFLNYQKVQKIEVACYYSTEGDLY